MSFLDKLLLQDLDASALARTVYDAAPASPSAFDDAFDDGSAELAARGWTVTDAAGAAVTREGDVDPWLLPSAIGAGAYRSTLRNGQLLLQTSAPLIMRKPVDAASALYTASALCSASTMASGTGNTAMLVLMQAPTLAGKYLRIGERDGKLSQQYYDGLIVYSAGTYTLARTDHRTHWALRYDSQAAQHRGAMVTADARVLHATAAIAVPSGFTPAYAGLYIEQASAQVLNIVHVNSLRRQHVDAWFGL